MLRDMLDTWGASALGCVSVGVIGAIMLLIAALIWGCG